MGMTDYYAILKSHNESRFHTVMRTWAMVELYPTLASAEMCETAMLLDTQSLAAKPSPM